MQLLFNFHILQSTSFPKQFGATDGAGDRSIATQLQAGPFPLGLFAFQPEGRLVMLSPGSLVTKHFDCTSLLSKEYFSVLSQYRHIHL